MLISAFEIDFNADLTDMIGIVKLKFAPLFLLFSVHIFPPCFSIIFLQMYRPRPVPDFEPVTNFVKSLSFIFDGMPGPLSIILTNTVLLLSCLSKDTIISPSC